MNIEIASPSKPVTRKHIREHVAAGGIIVSHTLQHLYNQGFYVILPVIYTALGLNPISAGIIGMVRQVSSGTASMVGGFMVDRLQSWRIPIMYISLMTIGVGYLLIAISPTYLLILPSLAIAGAATSLWHPPAISLLSQQYPQRRGFLLALHRSTGNIGDTIGPLIVGALLVTLAWQTILFGAFPVAVVLALLLWIILRQVGSWQKPANQTTTTQRPLREQANALKEVLQSRELILLLLVSGLSGLAQGSLSLWLSLYLQQTQGMGSLAIGMHLGLLSGVGIGSAPLLGILSDRLGRKRVIFIILVLQATIATLMALFGRGIILTILVGFMGAFLFALNPLVQAASLDFAEGKKLEGSMIGLLWGSNAAFNGISPVLVGFLITSLGYGILFWYVAAMNTVAALTSIVLLLARPQTRTATRTPGV
ncbi:MAG: MFS transporter [Chloroflexi bacterium]|nr:MFS transporter [Chloroflexota bacterium]